MTHTDRNQLVAVGAAAIAVFVAVGAVLATGQVEVSLFLVATVIAGLVCFDAAMGEKAGSFWPWAALSLAPVMKTVPTVWYELRADNGALSERYDHLGSLLFGLCVLVAVIVLARPAETLGTWIGAFDYAVIAGTAVTAGLAGTSVAFLFDRDFGSVAAARTLESSTWFVIGGLLAATPIAASHARIFSRTLAGILVYAATVAGFLAVSVAGTDVDRGWWAVLFALLTVNAALNRSRVGTRAERDRRSNVAVAVALLAGVVAAGCAITARSDRDSWGPGWALLGVLSLALFLLALSSRPLEEQRDRAIPVPPDIGVDPERAALAKARAVASLDRSPTAAFGRLTTAAITTATASASMQPRDRVPLPAAATSRVPRQVPRTIAEASALTVTASSAGAGALAASASSVPPVKPFAEGPGSPDGIDGAAQADARAASADSSPQSLSDAGIVASAQAAAAVRTAPHPQRHTLAPLAQAHHFDPSTGLLSAAGLQHAIARAFDVQRKAGHVTILLFMIRDLDQIEREHGRLTAAAVTREVADRVRTLLADGTGARFTRSAYAVIFVGDRSNSAETIQSMAQVLLRLRTPIDAGALGFQIDVVAGMAQCYESENAAEFVQRANQGLARAVRADQPSLVAMP